jgi:hypothetical protein
LKENSMTYVNKVAFSFGVMTLVAACGGTTVSAPISLTPASFNEGPVPIGYDPATGALSVNAAAVVAPRTTETVSNGNASIFRSAAPLHHSAIAQNSDVYAVASANLGATGVRGLTYGRRGPTELPTTGTATFSGDYAGIFGRDPVAGNQSVFAHIDGDANLAVDMANMSLTGSVTNRMAYDDDGVAAPVTTSFADVQIAGGTIAADGTFDANVTGGERTYSGGTYNFVSGSANGAFGGATGNAVAGVIQINQTNPNIGMAAHTEVGSFVATRN